MTLSDFITAERVELNANCGLCEGGASSVGNSKWPFRLANW